VQLLYVNEQGDRAQSDAWAAGADVLPGCQEASGRSCLGTGRGTTVWQFGERPDDTRGTYQLRRPHVCDCSVSLSVSGNPQIYTAHHTARIEREE